MTGMALVTGGTRGIGRAVALRLAEAGAGTVVVNHLQNDAEAERTRRDVAERGAHCVVVRANLAYPEEVDRVVAACAEVGEPIGSLVHCAALTAFKPLRAVRANQWDLTMNVNARSLVLLAGALAPSLQGGAIVAVSSLGSRRVLSDYGAMGATKAALEAVVRYLAVELAGESIRVNGVVGGLVLTDSVTHFPHSTTMLAAALTRTPAGRHGEPEDIADAVMFLLSPAARWIYGQNIVVDGGLSLR